MNITMNVFSWHENMQTARLCDGYIVSALRNKNGKLMKTPNNE